MLNLLGQRDLGEIPDRTAAGLRIGSQRLSSSPRDSPSGPTSRTSPLRSHTKRVMPRHPFWGRLSGGLEKAAGDVDKVPLSVRGAMSAPDTSRVATPCLGQFVTEPRQTDYRPKERWIYRSRLEAQLEAAMRAAVTVVTGPPGAGKTVLLEQWARARSTITNNITQLPLSVDDDDPDRFWRRVSSAFLSPTDRWRSCFVLDDEEAKRPHRTAAQTLLACLIDLVPTIVVLDNYHVICNPEVIASFAWFRVQPASAHSRRRSWAR